VNVEGAKRKKVARSDLWKCDPRVDSKWQLLTDGIYGRAGDGLFSRGHMTRREDPNWGTLNEAKRADDDTFHVTNACPQYQSFNAPIWLGLEDYILRNAQDDSMRVNVFTGPVFDDEDPEYAPKGVPPIKVPLKFWKVVAFRHDDTKQLASAAYIASQASVMPRKNMKPAFVFGEYEEFQLTVAEVQDICQLGFGVLEQVDVLGQAGHGFRMRLTSLDQAVLR